MKPSGFDVLLLTVSVVERDACLKHLDDPKPGLLKSHLDDAIENISVRTGFFGDLSVVILCVLSPDGNRVSSALTMAVFNFNPAIIISMGVGGGVPGESAPVEIGDVVISNAIADHTKSVERGTHIDYFIKSQKVRDELEPAIDEISKNALWIDRLQSPKKAPGRPLSSRIIVAPISAGNVLAEGDDGPLAQAMKSQVPEARAIDMESAAGIRTATLLGLPFVAVRGISDLRVGKNPDIDSWSQPWAMAHACAAGFHLLASLSAYIQNSRADLTLKRDSIRTDGETTSASVFKEDVDALAKRLLEINSPCSLALLFPNSKESTKLAFEKCLTLDRYLTEKKPAGETNPRSLMDLLEHPERMHLVVGPPGSGKSQLFWKTAQALLNEGRIIPVYLRLAQYANWEAVKLAVRRASSGLNLADLVADPRICFFLDGWSEFATESSSLEKRNLLNELAKSRIIANGKTSRDSDSAFKIWELSPLSNEQVISVLKEADPLLASLNPQLQSFLTLPLFLSIHVLSNATESTIGAVLRRFHESLARDLPPGFTDTLAEAVARFTLANENSYNRLAVILRDCSHDQHFSDAVRLLEKLGTIVDRDGAVLPIHDLYLDWLAGSGILANSLDEQALDSLKAREGISLAIQSGEYSRLPADVKIEEKDAVFAAMLESSWASRKLTASFKTFVDSLLSDPRLAVKNRGGLAALNCGRSHYLLPALEVLNQLIAAQMYRPEWQDAIRPDTLIQNVSTIEDWFGGPGTDFFFQEVAAKGGSEWLPVLHGLASKGKINFITASSVALAVSPTVPQWVAEHLDELIAQSPWKLSACAGRKSNTMLAKLIASDYERYVTLAQTKSGSGFVNLAEVLAACGDDSAFYKLLGDYPTMGEKARELLGFAVSKKGEPWLSRFQLLGKAPHSFTVGLSDEIDDATARQWISSGREDEGWRILITRHGASVMPEVINALPANFAGLHHIPALDCIRYCSNTPPSTTTEILNRLGSPMMPRAMEECLAAIASVYPEGVPTLVNLVVYHQTLPGYHLAQLMDLYAVWHERSGLGLAVNSPGGQSTPFPQWLANYAYERGWEQHFTARVIAKSPEVAISLILGPLLTDLDKSEEILQWLKNVKTPNVKLWDHMLSHSKLAKYVPDVFALCFQELSNADIEKCFENADVEQYSLLTKLSTNSSPKHRSAHFNFIQKLLSQPLEIHKYRQVASMLRCYSEDDVLKLLQSLKTDGENWLWLVREVERARGELLINELGQLRLGC